METPDDLDDEPRARTLAVLMFSAAALLGAGWCFLQAFDIAETQYGIPDIVRVALYSGDRRPPPAPETLKPVNPCKVE